MMTTTRMVNKAIVFIKKNNNFAHASRFFVNYLAAIARIQHDNSFFHAPASWSTLKQHKNSLVFLNLDMVFSDSTPDKFDDLTN